MKRVRFKGNISGELNQLAREEMKERLLGDILMDMEICKLEGWSISSYLLELKELIDNIIIKNKLDN